MAVVDPDRARHHTHAEKQRDLFGHAQIIGAGHIPQHPAQKQKLQGKLDLRQQGMQENVVFIRLGVGVGCVQPANGIQK